MLLPTRPSDVDYRGSGFWEDRTLSSFLDEAAETQPESIAVNTGGQPITYRQLRGSAAAIAAGLEAHGVLAHDVATIVLPNWHEAVAVIHGASWAGCVVNPVVSTYRRAELSFIVRQSGSRALFILHRFREFDYVAMVSEMIRDLPDPPLVVVVRPQGALPAGFVSFDELSEQPAVMARRGAPEDICLLLYTSGTTSEPKGVLHNHQTVVWEMRSIIREFGLGSGDVTFMASPVGHLIGIVYGVYLPALLGESVSLLDIWSADAAVSIVERDRCRVSLGATPFLRGLVSAYRQRGANSSLRLFICGGADVPADLVAEGCDVLDAVVTRTYGSSELPTFSVSGLDTTVETRSCTDGLPIHPAQGRLIDARNGVGELAVRGPELFLGYLDASLNTTAFTPDGYFRTGDLVEFGADGSVTVRGRVKDIIIRGGENISALEVETNLRGHEAIADVAVVGYPDPTMGERIAAFLVLHDGWVESPSPRELSSFLQAAGLAAHKCPETVEVVGVLPTTATGKVRKQVLRQRLCAR